MVLYNTGVSDTNLLIGDISSNEIKSVNMTLAEIYDIISDQTLPGEGNGN